MQQSSNATTGQPARPKNMVKIPFIVFHLARLIFTDQASQLGMICP